MHALISTTFWDTFVITTNTRARGFYPKTQAFLDVLDIVRMDGGLFPPVRVHEAERTSDSSYVVDVFCTYRSPYEYLNPNAYIRMDQDRPVDVLIKDMMGHILRYREPYVRERIEEWWKSCAKSSSKTPLKTWMTGKTLRSFGEMMQKSFPYGLLLTRFLWDFSPTQWSKVMHQKPPLTLEILKDVALQKTAECMGGWNHKHFEGRLRSPDHSEKKPLAWRFSPLMMPTTGYPLQSPKFYLGPPRGGPERYVGQLWANVASFAGNTRRQREVWKAIKALSGAG